MGEWSEEITQSSFIPVLYINPELPRRSAELKRKHPSGDDWFTRPCYHIRLHINNINSWRAAALHAAFAIATHPTAGHDLHPSRVIRWLINAHTRTENRNRLPECIVMWLTHNWMTENETIKKNNHIKHDWKSVILRSCSPCSHKQGQGG